MTVRVQDGTRGKPTIFGLREFRAGLEFRHRFRSNGEIGRRARLRIWYRKVCGFKSLFEHSFCWRLSYESELCALVSEFSRLPSTFDSDSSGSS